MNDQKMTISMRVLYDLTEARYAYELYAETTGEHLYTSAYEFETNADAVLASGIHRDKFREYIRSRGGEVHTPENDVLSGMYLAGIVRHKKTNKYGCAIFDGNGKVVSDPDMWFSTSEEAREHGMMLKDKVKEKLVEMNAGREVVESPITDFTRSVFNPPMPGMPKVAPNYNPAAN